MIIIHYIPSISRKDGGTTAYMQLLGKALGTLASVHIVTHYSVDDVEITGANLHYISSSFNGKMKKDWSNLLDTVEPEVVHINCCWSPSCSFLQKWAKKKGFPTILSPHGMLEPWIIKRNFWTKKLPALLLYQKQAIREADCIHATAESEMSNILKLKLNSKVEIIPNGIEIGEIAMKNSWKQFDSLFFMYS